MAASILKLIADEPMNGAIMRETCEGVEGNPDDLLDRFQRIHCPGCPAERAADVQGLTDEERTALSKLRKLIASPIWTPPGRTLVQIAIRALERFADPIARPDVQPGGLAPEPCKEGAMEIGDCLDPAGDDADLVAARAVHAKMTPGDWVLNCADQIRSPSGLVVSHPPSDRGEIDAFGIVYFVNRIPGYLDEIERLRRQVEELTAERQRAEQKALDTGRELYVSKMRLGAVWRLAEKYCGFSVPANDLLRLLQRVSDGPGPDVHGEASDRLDESEREQVEKWRDIYGDCDGTCANKDMCRRSRAALAIIDRLAPPPSARDSAARDATRPGDRGRS